MNIDYLNQLRSLQLMNILSSSLIYSASCIGIGRDLTAIYLKEFLKRCRVSLCVFLIA